MSQCSIICSKNIFRLEQHPASTILIRFQQAQDMFLFCECSFIPALWPTQPPIRWASKALPPGVKRPGVWTRARQSNDRFKNKYSYTPPQYESIACAGTTLHLLHRTVPSHIWIYSMFFFNPVVITNRTEQELLHSNVYNISGLGDRIQYATLRQTGLYFQYYSTCMTNPS